MVPQKITRMDNTTYLLVMSLGVLIVSLILYALVGCPHASNWIERAKAIFCGLVWGLGTLAFAASIQRVGLAIATPIKNTTGVLGTLAGLIFLQEWKTTNPWFALMGSVLIVAAAIVIGQTGNTATTRRHSTTGVIFALLAAVFYSSYLIPLKEVVNHVGYWEFTPWMALGICISAAIAVVARRGGMRDFSRYPLRNYAFALLAGVFWIIALYTMTASLEMIDVSIAWSLAQLNTIPAVFIGILAFHEIDFRSHRRMIYLGLLVAALGTILLGWAKHTPPVAHRQAKVAYERRIN
jgi:glucose uptake protein GlcU